MSRREPFSLPVAKTLAAKRAQYSVDLREQQAECEANYARLIKLIPNFPAQKSWQYCLLENGNRVMLNLLEQAPYTSTLEVAQQQANHPFESARVLRVRMYHDARMAEVVAWNKHWNTRSRYHYPNENMYQRDEKRQLNRFLGEWLAHCLAQGRVETRISNEL